LGSEHPLSDSVQLVMLLLFFVALGVAGVAYFMFSVSTVLVEFTFFPLLLFPAIISLISGVYLVMKVPAAVFCENADKPQLFDSGVYSLVRHPMYLGTLLFCLGFFSAVPFFISLVV
jgi:protein-S-isoprenylcysteine O-methyltransferase Ste14